MTDEPTIDVAGVPLHPGAGTGPLLRLDEPLSLWGGTGPDGRITDPHHPQAGQRLTGTVVVMTGARGSSSSSSVLAELLRTGNGPAAFVLTEPDRILVLGALVAAELYGRRLPIVAIGAADHGALPDGEATVVCDEQTGTVAVRVAERQR